MRSQNWNTTSGPCIVPRGIEGTAKPFTVTETTGGNIMSSNLTVIPLEEKEFSSLLASGRERIARKGITQKSVDKAMREVRYGR
jgi:hypothetical protein